MPGLDPVGQFRDPVRDPVNQFHARPSEWTEWWADVGNSSRCLPVHSRSDY